jgi:adenosylmethionine-8-amino-7-oxononanoate aminotransferase
MILSITLALRGMTRTDKPAAQFAARLHQIADTLGITVDQFYTHEGSQEVADMLAVLRAYAAITDAQGRQRVLLLAQREATRSQDESDPSDLS